MGENMNKNIIKFKAVDDYTWNVIDKPQPSSNFLPNWYKEAPIYGNNEKFRLNPFPNVTFKRCFPMLDSLSAGYINPLWADFNVLYEQGSGVGLKWIVDKDIFSLWTKEQISTFEIPEGYDSKVFKYVNNWYIETPPGWSCLITHPIGYKDLPFMAVSGIVDTDSFQGEINTPIIFKNNWTGIVEKGTPMFQIIPFKRSNWSAEYEVMKEKENYYNGQKLRTKLISYYGKNFREKRVYQ
jgi:hypothetical protein